MSALIKTRRERFVYDTPAGRRRRGRRLSFSQRLRRFLKMRIVVRWQVRRASR